MLGFTETEPVERIDDEPEDRIIRIIEAMRTKPILFASACCTPLGLLPSYPFFLETVQDLVFGGDHLIAKSRQMMGSWAGCVAMLYKAMFCENYSGLVTSRKQSLVDDGGAHSTQFSLLGRMRYLYRSLPEGLRAAIPLTFAHLRITNEPLRSHVTGESTTVDSGRGGTFDDVLADEWAFVPQSETTFAALRHACHRGLWFPSTPNGPNGNFARLWRNPVGFKVHRLHWTRHPLRWDGKELDENGRPTSEWYRAMCATMTPDQIARELDIDFTRSIAGQVWPEFSYDVHFQTDISYDPDLPLCGFLDFGIGAPTAGGLFQLHGAEMWVLADYEMANQSAEANAENLWAIARRIGFKGEKRDIRWYGDPAGNAREIKTGSSIIRGYQRWGFENFTTPRVKAVGDGLRLVRRKLINREIYFSTDCTIFALRIPGYHYPTDDGGNVVNDLPKHDMSSHVCDALRYGATSVWPVDCPGSVAMYTPAEPLPAPRVWSGDGPPRRSGGHPYPRSWQGTVIGPWRQR